MRRSKQIVEDIAEALCQARHYEGATGFMLAPLMQRGGARSWHVVDWETEQWVRDDDEYELVGLEVDPASLPKLPKSKIGMWALSFVDEKGEHLKPEIQIVPPRPPDQKAAAQPPAPRLAGISPRNETIAVLTDSLRQSHEDLRLSQRQMQEDLRAILDQATKVLSMARTEIEHASAGRRADLEMLARAKQEELDGLRGQIKTMRTDLEEVVRANRDLSETNLQLRYNSQFWQTVQGLFAEKPETLIQGLRELFGGVAKMAKELKDDAE